MSGSIVLGCQQWAGALLQHYIRQIKHLIAERMPTSKETRIGTIEALDKAIQLVRVHPTANSRQFPTPFHPRIHCKCLQLRATAPIATIAEMNKPGTVSVPPVPQRHHNSWSQDIAECSFLAADDAWSQYSQTINERLLLTVRVSFPDGAIIDLRRTAAEMRDLEVRNRQPQSTM